MTRLSTADLDALLTAQIAVAWAGEQGDENPRLGWWRTQLDEEFVGHDLFRALLPRTGQWAALVAARRAAKVVDDGARKRSGAADTLFSLYHFGFDLDEALNDRLRTLVSAGEHPTAALPGLVELLGPFDPAQPYVRKPFARADFADWCAGHAAAVFEETPTGRCVADRDPLRRCDALIGALVPLTKDWPAPYAARGAA